MSKRRLTRQQRDRIAARQEGELSASGQQPENDASEGLVISHFGQQLEIETASPDAQLAQSPTVIRCHQRANLPAIVTGDRVAWRREADGSGVVVAVEERRSLFGRPNPSGEFRPLAANVDRVVVVIALVPQAFANLVDRYLVAIEMLGLQAMIVLNKADLLNPQTQTEIDSMLSIYEELGYASARVSATQGSGIDSLSEAIRGETAVLVGQSGVGKSSLLNSLAGIDTAQVGELSDARYKGTHTTTATRLFHLDGFDLIDSPGIREFHLTHCEAPDVLNGFRELRELALTCKFRDCSHREEPGCAIQAALAAGAIRGERLDSYFRILQSIDSKQ